jgi:hypothetical protein
MFLNEMDDIAAILLKVALNKQNQSINQVNEMEKLILYLVIIDHRAPRSGEIMSYLYTLIPKRF